MDGKHAETSICDTMLGIRCMGVCLPVLEFLCLLWHETYTKSPSARSVRETGRKVREKREEGSQQKVPEVNSRLEIAVQRGHRRQKEAVRRWKPDREKSQQKSERRLRKIRKPSPLKKTLSPVHDLPKKILIVQT